MSSATTQGIQIDVSADYLPDRSDPRHGVWVHTYEVIIANLSDVPVTLMSRHWVITNTHGTQDHVRGAGVVGEQPRIEPGKSYRYRSGAPVDTAVATMHGSYRMRRDDGGAFDAEVAPFTLAEPYAIH